MDSEKVKWLHETFLYPVVRVFGQKAAGSGTVVYSKPNKAGDFDTFVLTNHHVVDDCISHKKDWDSILKRNTEKEFLEKAKVETFSYARISEVTSSNRHSADIVAYDKGHDLALLKVDSPQPSPFAATLIPKEKIADIKLFMEIVVSGCSLAHDPFCNYGQITYLKEFIEKKKYIMVNAGSYFGNSGGALFLRESGELIGVPSRVSGIQLGFNVDIITWMGFSAHPERLYEFLDEQELRFIYDPEDSYDKSLERRKVKERDALLALKAEIVRQGEEEL
jgi:S1-C subfamily serine protease